MGLEDFVVAKTELFKKHLVGETMSPHFTYGKNDDSSIQPTLEIDLIRGMAFKFAFS